MRRPFLILSTGMLAGALLMAGLLFAPTLVSAATTIAPTTTCSNGVANTGGLGLICRVTIVNTITPTGGSSKTVVLECHGAAGAPTAKCSTKTWLMNRLVTRVTQCNDSINGGGGTLRCSVTVTNNYVGSKPNTPGVTVNQCVGSGGGITKDCDPFPANTTGAAITQCNGSANGGTLVGLRCTATGTKAASGGVRINQCNGSANGGGALVICSASQVNRVVTTSTTSSGGTTTPALPATSTIDGATSQPAGPNPLVPATLALAFLISLVVVVRRTEGRRTGR